jgi:tetratricopeptide (TPR) repeat protein
MKASANTRHPMLVATLLALGFGSAPAVATAQARPAATGAQGSTGVAQLNEEGAALYAARDYRRAIEKFIQAYAIDADPNLLFNIARCYEELGETDAAIEKYEVFVKTPGADARGRQRARESLEALRAARDAARAPTSSTPTPSPAAPSAEGQAVVVQDSEPPSQVWPWLTLGGSVAFAAAGTAFYVLGASDHAEVTDAAGYADPDGVATMGEAPAEPAPAVGFALWPSPSGAAISMQGSF